MTSQTKLKQIASHTRAMIKLYPLMDRRKIKRDAYFRYSAAWKALLKRHPNSILRVL